LFHVSRLPHVVCGARHVRYMTQGIFLLYFLLYSFVFRTESYNKVSILLVY